MPIITPFHAPFRTIPYTSITPTSTSPFLASSLTVFCNDFSSFSSAGLLIRFFATCAILLTEPWRCIGGGAIVLAASVGPALPCVWVEARLWLWLGSAGSVGEAC